jgi:short-subunit dehydrogenase
MNKTALITGATSGIGREFAERFASIGYDLIITGRRKNVIEKVAKEISRKNGVKVSVILAELSVEAGISKVLKVIEKAGHIDVLINNAGFGLDNLFYKETIENHIKMISVHINAAVRLTHAVLPGMVKAGSGIIINISSIGSFLPTPINAIYGGTKAFLNIFTESIYIEMRRKGIKMQSLCPGFTSTDFHIQMGIEEEIKKDVKNWMTPEQVVNCSMKALTKGNVICIPGIRNRLLCLLPSILSERIYYWVISIIYKKYLEN